MFENHPSNVIFVIHNYIMVGSFSWCVLTGKYYDIGMMFVIQYGVFNGLMSYLYILYCGGKLYPFGSLINGVF